MNKKAIRLLLTAPVFIVLFLYISSIISQIIMIIKSLQTFDETSLYMKPEFNFFISIKYLFYFPYNLYGIFLLIGFTVFIILRFNISSGNSYSSNYDNERNFEFSGYGIHGTSGYMSDEDISKNFNLVSNLK